MKLPIRLRSSAVWLRLQVPVALLVALLQRAPAVRALVAADEMVAASPLGAVLKSALAATASLGALHSLAGATVLVASTPGPLAAKVGTAVPTVAFTVTDTINIASWKIGGTLPPGVEIAAREDANKKVAGTGGMLDATTMGEPDPYDPYGSVGGNNTTTPFLRGTPTQAGSYTITLQAFEFAGLTGLASNTFSYTIQVAAADTGGSGNVAPTISAQPQSRTAGVGETVTFTVAASGTPAPTFQWRKDGNILATATSATLTLTNVQLADAGVYTVTVSNAAGNVTSAAATLTVNPPAGGTAPAIAAQPGAQTVASGSTAVFSVTASGTPAPTFQWRKDGVNLPGATGPILVVPGATAANAGSYTVAVTNSAGTVVSAAAALTVATVPATAVGRLVNLSILTTASTGAKALTIGATVGGAGTGGALPLVIRAVGPTLNTAFGLGGVMPDPVMQLNAAGNATPLATNSGWGGSATLAAAFSSVGAFALPASSRDAALVPPGGLAGGGYTVQVTSQSGASGLVIAEIYDASGGTRTAATPRLTNLSTLTSIDAGANLAVGFVLGGDTARTLLVRGVGPTLASAFGIQGTMAAPKLELFNNATNAKLQENAGWGGDAAIASASASVGAFALANAATKDAVLLVTLAPGQYSARVSGADNGGGTAIIEVYEVP
jgi:hypothetical protein